MPHRGHIDCVTMLVRRTKWQYLHVVYGLCISQLNRTRNVIDSKKTIAKNKYDLMREKEPVDIFEL